MKFAVFCQKPGFFAPFRGKVESMQRPQNALHAEHVSALPSRTPKSEIHAPTGATQFRHLPIVALFIPGKLAIPECAIVLWLCRVLRTAMPEAPSTKIVSLSLWKTKSGFPNTG
jgi:hypothetical protein